MTMMLFEPAALPQNKTGTVTKLTKEQIATYFVEFWGIFPKRDGNNPKWKAEQKFTRLVENGENPETIIAGARRYHAQCTRKRIVGTEKVCQAITWLNGKMWLNDPDAGTEAVEPKSFADMARELRERAYHQADEQPAALLPGDGG